MNEKKKESTDELDSTCNNVSSPPSANELLDTSSAGKAVECNKNGSLANSMKKKKSSLKKVDTSKLGDSENTDVGSTAGENAETKDADAVQENTSKTTDAPIAKEQRSTRMSVETTLTAEKTKEVDAPEPLKNCLKTSDSASAAGAVHPKTEPLSSNISTENLLSVLEGEPEAPSKNKVPEAKQSITAADNKPAAPGKSTKRYIYKLKAKSGRVLRYTSSIPIVLKKPVITLTKMEEEFKSEKLPENEADAVDSDNSTKENHAKENDASGDNVIRPTRRKGRPPLSQKAPVVASDDRNSSDTADGKATPSFTMQTRKRQLRFLPDGRLVTPGKKLRSADVKRNGSESSSSESDLESDEDSPSERKYKKVTKRFGPSERKLADRKGGKPNKKVFDYESYIREKSSAVSSSTDEKLEVRASASRATFDSQTVKSAAPLSTSTPLTKKNNSVDPAQLLSSLIGVPIAPSQLNVVKFKPKVIQERKNNANTLITPKKVTFQEDKPKQQITNSQVELLKNTPYKLVSKPLFQKILPKPSLTPLKSSTPVIRKPADRALSPSRSFTPIAPKIMTSHAAKEVSSEFKNFTDTRVVKTREGPKKVPKNGTSSTETIYDLLRTVFEQMPSWNLHVIPDTNSFCIAQVSRGRMGIPILKKSIELNSEFFAKVYVHQLHCKRYDGVYDTESKLLSLIKEIDSLAA